MLKLHKELHQIQFCHVCFIKFQLQQDIDIIESVQRRPTKRLPELFNYSYIARLEHLKLESLEKRRLANDLVFIFNETWAGYCRF